MNCPASEALAGFFRPHWYRLERFYGNYQFPVPRPHHDQSGSRFTAGLDARAVGDDHLFLVSKLQPAYARYAGVHWLDEL